MSSVYRDSEIGEFYDLDADPRERVNLWDDADHAKTKTEMLSRLIREQLGAVDATPFPAALA